MIDARLIAYGGHRDGLSAEQSDCVADLMDAVHTLPELLQRWEHCNEQLLRSFLRDFDDRWQHRTTARLLITYLRFVEPGAR